MITLYDAYRCPFCARTRIVLAEKGVEFETVTVDLDDRPTWLRDKNPLNKVPVLEEDTLCLPESAVINEYLEERFPDPALLPSDLNQRALIRLQVDRFDTNLGDAYYAFRRQDAEGAEWLSHCLGFFERNIERWAGRYTLAEIAYVPWLIRLRDMLGVQLPEGIARRLDELAERPSIAAELETVAAFA